MWEFTLITSFLGLKLFDMSLQIEGDLSSGRQIPTSLIPTSREKFLGMTEVCRFVSCQLETPDSTSKDFVGGDTNKGVVVMIIRSRHAVGANLSLSKGRR